MTLFPSDIFFIFETQSLANASPSFIAQVGIVQLQESDVTLKSMFDRQHKLIQEKHRKLFKDTSINYFNVEECCRKFVLPFVLDTLDKQPNIKDKKKCPLWNTKSQTNQFFILLNALLLKLAENIELNKTNEDPMDYPFFEN